MDEDVYVGCISCMGRNDLCKLFGSHNENDNYAKLLEKCYNIKVNHELRYLCSQCITKLKEAVAFKEQITTTLSMLVVNSEEHLDDSLFEHDLIVLDSPSASNADHDKNKVAGTNKPIVVGEVGVIDKYNKKEFPCHFCENTYLNRKSCYTHLRMKHGLRLINDSAVNCKRERKKCSVCNRDFSQRQILNKHMLKEHGVKIEKRKALDCPLCDERVSYGIYFSDHLLSEHDIDEEIEELQFKNMDEFFLYKNSVQERTKFRFRKTTATKQTIEGLRSHYMCSQSGVYIYQGKGIRPTPERQIYKTGKACPAHMVVTETVDAVTVVFHKTHVGHGACPYYTPREKRQKSDDVSESSDTWLSKFEKRVDDKKMVWICETCGMIFFDNNSIEVHVRTHVKMEESNNDVFVVD